MTVPVAIEAGGIEEYQAAVARHASISDPVAPIDYKTVGQPQRQP